MNVPKRKRTQKKKQSLFDRFIFWCWNGGESKKKGKKQHGEEEKNTIHPIWRVIIVLFFIGCFLAFSQQDQSSSSTTEIPNPIVSSGIAPTPPVFTDCALRETIGGDTGEERLWTQIRSWCPYIIEASEQNLIDPYLVAAIIWIESQGRPLAYSKAGAVGLMQVMASDGLAAGFYCPNGPCFRDRPTVAQLRDPHFNVLYGTVLLAHYIRLKGSVREGLRAYGPANYGYVYADLVLARYHKLIA